MTTTIKFSNVSFTYDGAKTPSLRNIDLEIQEGEVVLITGPSGCGKTTLCSCINGLVPHFHDGLLEGEVTVKGYDTKKSRVGGLASFIGMVFQDPESQLVTSSVADEVAFGPENFGVPRDEISARVKNSLRLTRLEGFDDREPHNLSGGEQQACVVASVYALQPEIYVMDEPLANLDPAGRANILKLIVDVAKNHKKTLVIVEHDLDDIIPLVDKVVVMNKGEIIRSGPVAEVLSQGDIPHVFKRPASIRLNHEFFNDPAPITPMELHQKFYDRFPQIREGKNTTYTNPQKGSKLGKPIIQVKDLSFAYLHENQVLMEINFEINEGEVVAIMGKNGSGKTTLIRHMIGLLTPEQNKVVIDDQDVFATPTHQLAQYIGFCFQNPNHQLVTFNVKEEITFGLKAHNIPASDHEQRIIEALQIVEMEDMLNTEVFDLGKGQKQRLALASVLALRPRILIIDEPTTGQDPEMAEGIFNIIRKLNEAGTTVLMITHNMEQAAKFAHRAVVIREGKLTFDGSMNDLISNEKLVKENYLEIPETTKIARQFKDNGVPEWLVEFEDLRNHLNTLVN